MKLTIKPIAIGADEGFSTGKDLFKRKDYASRLTNIIKNTDGELVIALDAKWGEGKTTFVKMWRGFLKEHSISSIYFDAFENDFIEDPLLALSAQLVSLIDDDAEKDLFKNKAISAIKVLSRVGLRVGVKALTAGILDSETLEELGVTEKASDEASQLVDKYIGERLLSAEKDKQILASFRDSINKIADGINECSRIVFIIDELDRCKPTFALDLIERIKHVFSVPKVVFVLVMNKEQIEEVIRMRYGANVNSSLYLQKFIHIWAELPRKTSNSFSNGRNYLNKCIDEMEIDSLKNTGGIELYRYLVDHYNLSLRDIEKSLTNYVLIASQFPNGLHGPYVFLLIFISIIRVINPETYKKIKNGTILCHDLDNTPGLFRQAKLANFVDGHDDSGFDFLLLLIEYDLASPEQQEALAQKIGLPARRYGQNNLRKICSWYENLTIQ